MSTQPTPLTYEGVLELFRQTDQRMDQRMDRIALEAAERQKETERMFAEERKVTERMFQEAAEERKETERIVQRTAEQIETNNKAIGALTSKVGEMVEKLLGEGNLVGQFRELGIKVKSHSRNKVFGDKGTANSGEIDLFLEDGDIAILVEVKTTLKMDDVKEHIERLEKYRRFVDADGKSDKRFVGAVAGTVIAENVIKFAHDNGLYVIIQSARAVEIIPQPTGFVAHEW